MIKATRTWTILVWPVLCAAFLLALAPAHAQAQADERMIYVSPFVDFSMLDAAETFVVATDELFESEYESGFGWGFRVGARTTPIISLEAGYGFSDNDLMITEFDGDEIERSYDVDVHRFNGNFLYFLGTDTEATRPFLTAGLGVAHFAASEEAKNLALIRFINEPTRIESSTQFGFNIGAGVEGPLTDWVGYRAEIRDHINGQPRYGLPEEPLTPGGVFLPAEGTLHNFQFSIGAVFEVW